MTTAVSDSRHALEALVLDGYRSLELSRGQVSELLGQSFHETEAFLKKHNCGLGLSFEEHERSLHRMREFLAQRASLFPTLHRSTT